MNRRTWVNARVNENVASMTSSLHNRMIKSNKSNLKTKVKLHDILLVPVLIFASFSACSIFYQYQGGYHSTNKVNMAEFIPRDVGGIANKRAVFARLGVMMPLPKGHLEERKNSTNIEIVVSHCEEHVDWIAKYVGEEFNVKQITIISKCGKSVRGLEQLSKFAHTQVVRLKNLGRCDHSYAYWIKNNYKRIEANVDAVGEDIIIFLKDNKRFRRSYYHFDKFFTFLTDAGFGCIKKPECDCSNRCLRWRYIPMMSHNKSFVLDFSLEEYKRVRRDDNAAFLNEKYKNLKSWKEDMNIVLPESPSFPICYGGMFGLRKKYILNQPFSVWGNITKSLERGDNIIEGHYAERMWAGMLSDHNKVDTRVLDEVLGPTIRDMVPRHEDDHVCGMQGMYYVRRMKNMTALFEEKIKNYTTY